MDRSIRISAKTVDDAITEALIQLGVTSDRIDYEVIEKGSAGFLGIGMKQAVIEARIKQSKPAEVKQETVRKPSYSRKEKEVVVTPDTKAVTKPEVKPTVHIEKPEATVNIHIESNPKADVVTSEKEEKHEITADTIHAVEEFLTSTLAAMDMKVTLHSSIDQDGALYIDMVGEHMGILIGKRGQTLDSLQYLANRVANKHQENYVRIKLDIEDYRRRREETLTRLARNLAAKVKKTRRSVSLEPMNPYERRIIHSVLQADSMVTTHSEGEEPYRKVVITMKRRNRY